MSQYEGMNNATTLRLGDKVSGSYHDVPFTGVVAGFAGSSIHLDIIGRFEYLGTVRDGLWLRSDERADAGIRVLERQELNEGDVGEFQGHVFLRTKAA